VVKVQRDKARRIAVLTGLNEQFIGVNYQATADQFELHRQDFSQRRWRIE
jgi:hypothetical protein